jgi:hypothetical protein
MGVKSRLLRWFRRFLLKRLYAECKWQKLSNELDLDDFYKMGLWTGISNALDENSPHAKQTLREVINWFLYGMRYVRAYAYSKKGDRSGQANQ